MQIYNNSMIFPYKTIIYYYYLNNPSISFCLFR